MAKQSYRIPYGLEQSYADMMIAINNKDGSIGRVFPLLVVLSYILSFLACLFIVMKTPLGQVATPLQIGLFVVLWAALTIVLTKYDKTRRMNAQRVLSLLAYLPKRARRIYTRSHNDAGPFWALLGVESISEDGLIEFLDGTYGYVYRVVGSASILLFESDRDCIIARVDNFFRKWDVSSEICFLTMKEAQKVYRQLYSLKRRYDNLKNSDPDLRRLGEEQFRILRDYVGSEFKSIHQYMIVKSKDHESLRVANSILQSEVDSSALMIKQCIPLELEDTYTVLQSVFRKGGNTDGVKALR